MVSDLQATVKLMRPVDSFLKPDCMNNYLQGLHAINSNVKDYIIDLEPTESRTDVLKKIYGKLLMVMLHRQNVMEPSRGMKYFTYSPEDIIGPLNDVEEKYAPKKLYVAGNLSIPLPSPRTAVIGSREASREGLKAASDITRTLVRKGVVIVSGLAKGIDTSAHCAAIEEGGKTIAVLGTPLNRVYPRENSKLQEVIMRDHLAISQFPIGYPTQPKDFVIRNRTMALISDASIIVEAGNSSGSLHQGWEALRLGRPLFIWNSIMNDSSLSWPQNMLKYGARELRNPETVLDVLPSHKGILELTL